MEDGLVGHVRLGREAGAAARARRQLRTEEICFIAHGRGRIRIEGEEREVGPGDAIAVLPGQRHQLWNIGTEPLRLLCCCAPAYEDEDTVLAED